MVFVAGLLGGAALAQSLLANGDFSSTHPFNPETDWPPAQPDAWTVINSNSDQTAGGDWFQNSAFVTSSADYGDYVSAAGPVLAVYNPEPATIMTLLLGLLAIGKVARRRTAELARPSPVEAVRLELRTTRSTKAIARRCAVLVLLTASCASAQTQRPPFPWTMVTFELISTTGGPTRGSGYVMLASELFQPGAVVSEGEDLLGMLVNPYNIPSPDGPVATLFQAPDLAADPWLLTLDDQGRISNLNFFGREAGPNRDGFSIEGYAPFHLLLCAGAAVENACANGPAAVVDDLLLTVNYVSVINSIDEPGSVHLLFAGVLALAFAARRERRRGTT